MTNVVDEVLAQQEPEYILTHQNGTQEIVKLNLATQVITEGTPLNKALFDSIKSDIDARLLISDKASTQEAQTGTNDTKYMTPLKVAQSKLGSRIHIATGTVAHNGTIPQTSGYDNYFYIVTPIISLNTNVIDSNYSAIAGYNFKIDCSVNQSTRKVTCQGTFYTFRANSSQTSTTVNKNFNATYYEIAWN